MRIYPVMCFKCSFYGHSKENFSSMVQPPKVIENEEASANVTVAPALADDGDYGPWMLVEQRSRRSSTEGAKKGNSSKRGEFSGSRFQSLADSDVGLSDGTSNKGGWKLNKTLKGPGNRFKNPKNSRPSFADSMKKTVELIILKMKGNSANDLERHLEDNRKLPPPNRQGLLSRGIVATFLNDTTGLWMGSGFMTLRLSRPKRLIFFQNLYGENPGNYGNIPPSAFPSLSTDDAYFLGRSVTKEEIMAALFYMAPLKAPGSDGFQAAFFQNHWDTIGDALCEWVKKVFEGGIIDPEFNNTHIVLISKV
ncbi:hypothetical protein J1N35_015153 [Gossypium stocksii]|uniref:Uncharacterized protein n=1 Tax=Gossypium stocksii TaxID=47602 RepID=A0A9D3VVR4_9ROSI|nr:hypothetical protein J1N35_015153 [Gossypium stocksii]